MKTMYLAITHACNHRCRICPHGNAHAAAYLPAEEIAKRFAYAREVQGIEGVTLSGGEPLLHPEICEIFDGLQGLGLRTTVLTNGTPLADAAFLNTLAAHAAAATTTFVVSLHSHLAETHNRLAGADSFEDTLAGIDNLVRSGYTVQVKHCVHKGNYRLLRAFAAWFSARFPQNVMLHLCNIDYCGLDAAALREVAVSLTKTGRAIGNALDIFRKAADTRKITLSEVPLCTLRRRFWQHSIGTGRFLAYTDPQTDGVTRPHTVNGTRFPQCRRCKLAARCAGVWDSTARYLGLRGIPLFQWRG